MTKKDTVYYLVVEGKTNDEISQVVDMNRHDLCKIIRDIKKNLGTYKPKETIDIDKLSTLRSDGYSPNEIAEQLKITKNTVYYYLEKYNIPKPQCTHEQKTLFNLIYPLFKTGVSRGNIARKFNISVEKVSSVLCAFGYSFSKRDAELTDHLRNEIQRLCKSEISAKEIADKLNVSTFTVY